MSVKEATREKIAQARRLLHQTTDPSTAESLTTYIEELERRLLVEMGEGGSKNTVQVSNANSANAPQVGGALV
jgi:hypothetical protein